VDETGGAEAIGAEDVFDKNANGAFEGVQRIVKSNYGAIDKIRRE
jgi:hypothetical protein